MTMPMEESSTRE